VGVNAKTLAKRVTAAMAGRDRVAVTLLVERGGHLEPVRLEVRKPLWCGNALAVVDERGEVVCATLAPLPEMLYELLEEAERRFGRVVDALVEP